MWSFCGHTELSHDCFSELLVSIIRAGAEGDPKQFRKAVEALAAEERTKKHNILAEKIEQSLNIAEQMYKDRKQYADSVRYLIQMMDEAIEGESSLDNLQEQARLDLKQVLQKAR